MTGIKRQKKFFYWCERYIDENTNITKFKKPKLVYLDYEPTNSDAQVLALGTEYSKYLQVVGNCKDISKFKNKDRCYIFIKPPKIEEFDGMCNDADFEVVGDPSKTENGISLMLKKLSGNE